MNASPIQPSALPRALLFGGLLVVLVGLTLASRIAPYMVDDAFIFFRYAENLATGHGLTFNRGEPPVEGFSSPLWTLLLALFAKLFGSTVLPSASVVLGLIAYAASLALLLRLARLDGSETTPALLSSLLPAALWGFSAGAVYYAITGMETIAFVVIVLAVHGALAGRLPRWIGLIAGLLAFWTRPEAPFLLVAAVPQLLFARQPLRRNVVPWLSFAVAVALGGLTLLAFRWSVFHDVLPNTWYAKRPSLAAGFQYLWSGLQSSAVLPILLIGALGAVAGERRHRGYAAAAIAWVGAAVIEGGDWMPAARFFQPALALSALAAGGLGCWWRRGESRPRALFGMLVALVGVGTAVAGSLQRAEIATHNQMLFRLEEKAFTAWFQATGADSIAMVDIGGLGFACPDVRIVDLAGLTDARIGHAQGGSFRKRIDPGYVTQERRPAVIQLRLRKLPDRDATGTLSPKPEDALSQPESQLLADAGLQRDYRLLFVQAPRTERKPLYARAIYVRRDFDLPTESNPGNDIVYDRSEP